MPPPPSSPPRAADLPGLPPTLVTVGAPDLFLDEGVAFARRPIRAGVPTELHILTGCHHGFVIAGPAAPQLQVPTRYRRDALTSVFTGNRQ